MLILGNMNTNANIAKNRSTNQQV